MYEINYRMCVVQFSSVRCTDTMQWKGGVLLILNICRLSDRSLQKGIQDAIFWQSILCLLIVFEDTMREAMRLPLSPVIFIHADNVNIDKPFN